MAKGSIDATGILIVFGYHAGLTAIYGKLGSPSVKLHAVQLMLFVMAFLGTEVTRIPTQVAPPAARRMLRGVW